MRPLFNIPGSGAFAVALGITSGYPVGAKISNELFESGECTKQEAERLLSFTNTSGPLFIVSAIGIGMFNNIGGKIKSLAKIVCWLGNIS